MMEFMPLAKLPFTGSIYFIMETVTAIFGVIYFAFLSKDWFGYIAVGYAMQICGTIIVFFLPESPKYLFKKGSLAKTSAVLSRIAKINSADPDLVSFERVQSCY